MQLQWQMMKVSDKESQTNQINSNDCSLSLELCATYKKSNNCQELDVKGSLYSFHVPEMSKTLLAVNIEHKLKNMDGKTG